jgi:hypothetical protein
MTTLQNWPDCRIREGFEYKQPRKQYEGAVIVSRDPYPDLTRFALTFYHLSEALSEADTVFICCSRHSGGMTVVIYLDVSVSQF